MKKTLIFALAILYCVNFLTSCGQSGRLYLPPKSTVTAPGTKS